jgi:RNA polymerase sigma-70 factor (family 1)
MMQAAINGQGRISGKSEFEFIFRQYYQGLCRYVGNWIQDPDESEEIVQNVFVKLWEKHQSIQIDTSIKSYLYKSVYHSALNTIKHKKVKEQYLHMKQNQDLNSHIQSRLTLKELELRIEKALTELPEQCRLIFSMSRFQELKYREIADILNISVKTVENQMGKALKLMRNNLSDFLTVGLVLIHFLFLS